MYITVLYTFPSSITCSACREKKSCQMRKRKARRDGSDMDRRRQASRVTGRMMGCPGIEQCSPGDVFRQMGLQIATAKAATTLKKTTTAQRRARWWHSPSRLAGATPHKPQLTVQAIQHMCLGNQKKHNEFMETINVEEHCAAGSKFIFPLKIEKLYFSSLKYYISMSSIPYVSFGAN